MSVTVKRNKDKTTVIINQKMSGTGTIHDIESDLYDIDIELGTQYQYAVVAPSYYGRTPTRHKSLNAAYKTYKKLTDSDCGAYIIDRDGNIYQAYKHHEVTLIPSD